MQASWLYGPLPESKLFKYVYVIIGLKLDRRGSHHGNTVHHHKLSANYILSKDYTTSSASLRSLTQTYVISWMDSNSLLRLPQANKEWRIDDFLLHHPSLRPLPFPPFFPFLPFPLPPPHSSAGDPSVPYYLAEWCVFCTFIFARDVQSNNAQVSLNECCRDIVSF